MITFNSVLLILLTGSVSSFEITGVSQSSMNVSPGESVRLICTVSRAWEFCTWSLQEGEARCSLEWKRSKVTGNCPLLLTLPSYSSFQL